MSVLQTKLSCFSTVCKNREGHEWSSQIQSCVENADCDADANERVLRRKRFNAMKYLGETGCSSSVGYKKTESRIFTPEFVNELGAENFKARTRRNPWLNSKMIAKGMSKPSTQNGTVLPFGPQITVSDLTSETNN